MAWYDAIIGGVTTGGPLGALAGFGGGEATSGDLGQDILSMFTGGQTSGQEKLQRDQINAIVAGYGQNKNAIGNQYIGPMQGDIEEIARLRAYLKPGAAGLTGPLAPTSEERLSAERRLAQLEGNISDKLTYKPDWYQPQTSYETIGYTPESFTPENLRYQTEGELYNLDPSRYGIPEYEAAALQDPSEAAKALADEGGLAAQREALSGMQDIYKRGGLTAIDRARLEDIRRQNQMQDKAARGAILADLERRGALGSGAELAARLSSQQSAADRMSQEALGVEALAQQRSERALGVAGGMGRDLAEDIFRRQYQTGSAADIINQFNTQGIRDVQAATRGAQDVFSQYQRDMLNRDVGRLNEQNTYNTTWNNNAGLWNTEQGNAANQWNIANQIAANLWGANARNQGAMFNTANQTAANQLNAQNAWNQVGGWNTQQGNLGNLNLAQQMAMAGIISQTPTADWGQFANNLWNLNQAIGNEVQRGMSYGMGGQGGMISNMMPGSSGAPMSPIQTNNTPYQNI